MRTPPPGKRSPRDLGKIQVCVCGDSVANCVQRKDQSMLFGVLRRTYLEKEHKTMKESISHISPVWPTYTHIVAERGLWVGAARHGQLLGRREVEQRTDHRRRAEVHGHAV